MAKYASDFHSSDWSALDVVDPLCGGGRTLFTALSLGADVAGIDIDRTDIESTATFITQYCRENRIALAAKEERLRKLDARRWLFQIGRDDSAAACWRLAMPDKPASCSRDSDGRI